VDGIKQQHMKGFTKYLLGAAFALPVLCSLNSCKKTNPTNPVVGSNIYHQYYWVRYDKDSNTTQALAQFRIDGEEGIIHTLVDHESLNINRNLANYNPASREYTFSSNKLVNVEYILTKNAGEQLQNTIYTTDTSDVSFPPIFPTSINRNSGQTIDWDGREIVDSIETFFMIIDDLDPTHKPVYKQYANGKWIFNSGDLLHLNPGEVIMRLELVKKMPLQRVDSSASGRMEVVVRTSKKISLF
jgi:hypothetical protein